MSALEKADCRKYLTSLIDLIRQNTANSSIIINDYKVIYSKSVAKKLDRIPSFIRDKCIAWAMVFTPELSPTFFLVRGPVLVFVVFWLKRATENVFPTCSRVLESCNVKVK